MTAEREMVAQGDWRANLASALTFHASFDEGPNADYALGDDQLYSAIVRGAEEVTALIPGLGSRPLALIPGGGKFGGALKFTRENSHVVVYKAEQNVAYRPEKFRGTASFWLSLDPAAIPGHYCDPFQLTDKVYDDACIWVDFTKNDTPPNFRLGVFGDRSAWDVKGGGGSSEEFHFRLVTVAEPPFAEDRWTHVAITWDGVNDTRQGRARLYFDAVYQGATNVIPEHFSWDIANAGIRLGMGHFVGLIDDVALFNRPLSIAELRLLYGLERGVAELYQP
jgi:hypothetical protein